MVCWTWSNCGAQSRVTQLDTEVRAGIMEGDRLAIHAKVVLKLALQDVTWRGGGAAVQAVPHASAIQQPRVVLSASMAMCAHVKNSCGLVVWTCMSVSVFAKMRRSSAQFNEVQVQRRRER